MRAVRQDRVCTQFLAHAINNCIVSVSARSRSYGRHMTHATTVAAFEYATHMTLQVAQIQLTHTVW